MRRSDDLDRARQWLERNVAGTYADNEHNAVRLAALLAEVRREEREKITRELESMPPSIDAAQREAARKVADEESRARMEGERLAKVRANLTAWLADRSSQPETRHAWLEEQCRAMGLL